MWFLKPSIQKMQREGDIPGLILALGDKSPDRRAQAAEALQPLLNEGKALPSLMHPDGQAACVAALQDMNSQVRRTAALALEKLNARGAAEALAKALNHRDPDTRSAAAHALMALGDSRGDRFRSAAQAVQQKRLSDALNLLVALAEEAKADAGRATQAVGPAPEVCYATALGLAGRMDEAKDLLVELIAAAKRAGAEEGAGLATEVGLAYGLIEEKALARQAFEDALKRTRHIADPAKRTAALIAAARAARSAGEDDISANALALAKEAATSAGLAPIAVGPAGKAVEQKLVAAIEQAEAEIMLQPSGARQTFATFAKRARLSEFLNALETDIGVAIQLAGRITDSYARLLALVTLIAHLRGA